MDDKYEVTTDDGGTVVGPVTLDQIKRGIVAGRIPADAKGRLVGEADWRALAFLLAAPAILDRQAGTAETQPHSKSKWPLVAALVGAVAMVGLTVLIVRRAKSVEEPTIPSETAALLNPIAAAKEGFRLYDKKPSDEAAAVPLWERSCEQGNSLGCTGLGIAHMWGMADKKTDYPRAADLLKGACADGVMRACALVGQLHINGWGVPKDMELAKPLWLKACDAGEPRGCYWLGLSYRANDGPPGWRDPEAGLLLLKRACGDGYKGACEEVEKAVKQARVEDLRTKVRKKYWDDEPDAMCTGKGLPPYRWSYEGGTFAEDAEVAAADGCKPPFAHDDTTFCCPQRGR